MSNLFVDRQPVYPNRYKVTTADGSSYFITLERADGATVEGTALNATMLNKLLPESGGTITGSLTIKEQLLLEGALAKPLIFIEGVHYGAGDLPPAGTPGRIYFKKVE
jgi:hypothetical protein